MVHKFQVLDSWRGICACMVALFHFKSYNHFYDIPLFLHAGLFVDFFFVLSGFVIFINYHHKLRDGFGIGRFMFLRFGRLYPLHIATFLGYIFVELLQMGVPQLAALADNAPFQGPGSTPDYILPNILLLHSFGVGERLSFNSPSWSISAEFYTYLIFAGMIILFGKRSMIGIILIMVCSFTGLLIVGEFMTTAHYGILRCLYGFGAGALCALLWRKWDECKQKPEISSSAWTVIEVFTTVFVMLFVSIFKETPFVYLAPFVFAITIFVFTHEKGRVSDFLKHKVFIFLGALSYSIYMVHYFIAGKLFIPIAKVLQAKFDIRIISVINGKERLGAEMWHGDVITMLYMIIVISCSYITFRIIEEPFRKICRKVVYK